MASTALAAADRLWTVTDSLQPGADGLRSLLPSAMASGAPPTRPDTPVRVLADLSPNVHTARHRADDDEQVWPPDVEAAFVEALVKIPILGRRKIAMQNHRKSCGRNELIAEYIFQRTGRHRSRKQVSSHIQVLKHLRQHDPAFLLLLSTPDGPRRQQQQQKQQKQQQQQQQQQQQHTSGYPVMATFYPPPRTVLCPPALRIVEFALWSHADADADPQLYTSLSPEPTRALAPALALDEDDALCAQLARAGVDLAAPGTLLEAETSLVLPECDASAASAGTRPRRALAARLVVASASTHGPLTVTTRIDAAGIEVLNVEEPVQQLDATSWALPCAAAFWEHFLFGLAELHAGTAHLPPQQARRRCKEARAILGAVTMTQNIGSLGQIVWRFALADDLDGPGAARCTYRELQRGRNHAFAS